MILLIIFISLLFLVVLLLTNPIRLEIDSKQHIYKADWKYLMQANLILQDDEPIIHLKAIFWQKEIKILEIQSGRNEKTKQQTKSEKSKVKKRKSKFNFQKKYKRLLKAIQVKQFYLNIDTDDFVWNAYLYPIAYFLNNQKRQLHINFQGDQELLLEIQSRPIQIIYALLR